MTLTSFKIHINSNGSLYYKSKISAIMFEISNNVILAQSFNLYLNLNDASFSINKKASLEIVHIWQSIQAGTKIWMETNQASFENPNSKV